MNGIERIRAERERQISEEGWSMEHDLNDHHSGALARAAASYALRAFIGREARPLDTQLDGWPFALRWWKPSDDPLRNLARAGALIAAEIDRLLAERR